MTMQFSVTMGTVVCCFFLFFFKQNKQLLQTSRVCVSINLRRLALHSGDAGHQHDSYFMTSSEPSVYLPLSAVRQSETSGGVFVETSGQLQTSGPKPDFFSDT